MAEDISSSMSEQPARKTSVTEDDLKILMLPDTREMLRVGILGAFVGVLTAFAAWLLLTFIVSPVFCQGAAQNVCSSGAVTTYYAASVLTTAIAIAVMANWQVFRPLLIAVAAAAALWGMRHAVDDAAVHNVWEYYLSSALLYGVAYVLFYWLMRLKSFVLSVVLTVAAVIVIRLVLLA